jgi:hypothetical protein
MFRRLLIVLTALVVAGGSLPAQAAPVSGSATLDIVFEPLREGSGPGAKIDKIKVKFELDLVLTLSVSGVDITSVSVFTFKGLEYQSFIATGTIGALAFRSQFIFAPNIVEIKEFRDSLGLPIYCVNFADPNGPPPGLMNLFPCTGPLAEAMGHVLWWLIHGTDGIFNLIGLVPLHPAWANLILANIAENFDQLDAPLSFRKKVVDLSLSLAGLTIGLRGLFANIGSTITPAWRMGVVASVEGQTVSGITIRGETWIGARQGLECFAECKPLERIRGGKVETDFIVYEEKIFIRNLKIAGVTFGARLEFTFADAPSYLIGLSFLQLTQDFALAPFGLTVNNVINIRPDPVTNALTIVQDVITTSVKVGDVSVLAQFVIRPAVTGAFNIYFAQLISTFDAPGVKVTDILVPCIDENVCALPDGLLGHSLILSTSVGDVTLDIQLDFGGLFTRFSQAIIEVGWKLGNVTIRSSSVIGVDALLGQKIGIELKF